MSLSVLCQRMVNLSFTPTRRRHSNTSAVAGEVLEMRALLSAINAVQDLEITEVHLRINNDRDVILNEPGQPVVVQPGDQVQVTGFVYAGDDQADPLEGVIAFEAYLRSEDANGVSRFDYSDGRFGSPVNSDPITGQSVSHPGLDGGWNVSSSTDRMMVSMVRYFGNSAQVEGRFSINVQVDSPDFQHQLIDGTSQTKFKKGKSVEILGAWKNAGNGTLKNYSELDVYRADDLTIPVWVGILAGEAGPGETVQGEYVNPNPLDSFSERWTPSQKGDYILRFYGDPENVTVESDESNNFHEIVVTVDKKDDRVLNLVIPQNDSTSSPESINERFEALIAEIESSADELGLSEKDLKKVIKGANKDFDKVMKKVVKDKAKDSDFTKLDDLFTSLDNLLDHQL